MLKSLHFTNFKSWADVTMDCGPITGVFGTNSSGKSSLIQFLLLLKQTRNATDRAVTLELNGDLVRLGTIRDAIHQHDEERGINVDIRFKLPRNLTLKDATKGSESLLAGGGELDLAATINIDGCVPASRRLAYTLGGMQFELASQEDRKSSFALSVQSIGDQDHGFHPVRTRGRPEKLPGPSKLYVFPDQVRTSYQNMSFLADLELAYEQALDPATRSIPTGRRRRNVIQFNIEDLLTRAEDPR